MNKQSFSLKRIFDVTLAVIVLAFLCIPFLLLAVFVRLTSAGPILHWSERVGVNNEVFRMPKLRSMCVHTPIVSSHLLDDPNAFLTPIGAFLRNTSLDEIPQLWSILKGDMSFVGPRPVLSNETELIALRTQAGVHQLMPGLTGWAQINGRDYLTMTAKVAYDIDYLKRQSFKFDLYILWITAWKVLRRSDISH